jgi:bifunctional oligoribonuclease and PAP phosphatase NrnA
MITFDASSSDRLGVLAANAARAGELVVVDHHPSNTRFGPIRPGHPRPDGGAAAPGGQ